ncbi:MAG: hypothetical protein KGL20_05665 [Rhodospirillales bacterium]|nr:hypothetical protein [Rhodospirillales bacterium]MDE2458704.1 hypothetical protein [Rhodospirillales bacterium]
MNVFMQWVEHFGGKCVKEFDQSVYLQSFPEFLRGGCCMTLSCNWIAKDGDMDTFLTHINSKVGKAQVRGFQGLGSKASGPASQLGGYFVGYVSEVLKVYKCSFRGEVAIGNSRSEDSIREISRFVFNKDAYYQYHFQSSTDSSGHAIAFRKRGGEYAIFDPNYGMAKFTGAQAWQKFGQSLEKLLNDFYPSLGGHWELIRVYRNA